MVLPLTAAPPESVVRQALVRAELQALAEEQQELDRLRKYYDGDQPLVYATALFREIFGDAFVGFRDNWMQVIVNAVQTRFQITGFQGIDGKQLDKTPGDLLQTIYRDNEFFNLEQQDLAEGMLVESRGFVIVWPDLDKGANIQWQPAGIVRVRYSTDDRRKALWAVKHWRDDEDRTLVNIYTPDRLYKYLVREGSDLYAVSSTNALTEIPDSGMIEGLQKRIVDGEPWPLPHAMGSVPVVQFDNKGYRSEIEGHIPQQDALNKTLLDLLVASEFAAVPQRYAETTSDEPIGGWASGPGTTWHFKPTLDFEGNYRPGNFGTFEAMDPGNFIKVIEMWLQHMANTSQTPVRLFHQADRGGRGDAQSGDAMLVDDKPLNDKVEAKQLYVTGRHREVARLVARAASSLSDTRWRPLADDQFQRDLAPAWRDPRHEHRSAMLDEAQKMLDLGLPFKFVISKLGLSTNEIEEVERLREEEAQEKLEQEQARIEMQAQAQPNEPPVSNSPNSPNS